MTEMDWTRPPSDYVVVDGETGGRFGIDVRAWPKPEWDGYRRIAFGGERRRWFSEDGVAYIPPYRLVLRYGVEKPDPTRLSDLPAEEAYPGITTRILPAAIERGEHKDQNDG